MLPKKTAKKYTESDDKYFASVLENHTPEEALEIIQRQPKYKDRAPKSIKYRINYYIESKQEFTQEENTMLLQLYGTYGPKWSTITKIINRKCALKVRTQILSLIKKANDAQKFCGAELTQIITQNLLHDQENESPSYYYPDDFLFENYDTYDIWDDKMFML